MSIKAII